MTVDADVKTTLIAIQRLNSEIATIWCKFADAVLFGHPQTREQIYAAREKAYRATELHAQSQRYVEQLILQHQAEERRRSQQEGKPE